MENAPMDTASEPSSVGIASVERLRLRDGRRVVLATLDVSHLRACGCPRRRPSWSPQTADGGPWQPSSGLVSPLDAPAVATLGFEPEVLVPEGSRPGVTPGVEVVAPNDPLQPTSRADCLRAK